MDEIVKGYIAYLSEWSAVRFRARWAFPQSWEDFRAEWEAEDEQDARDWDRHVRSMRCQSRYV